MTARARAAVLLALGFAAALPIAAAPLKAQQGRDARERILQLARRRHRHPDTTLQDYRSRLNTLVSVGWMSDPLAPPKLILASELASSVAWRRGAGLQVRMLGQRYVTSFGRNVEAGLDFSRPWFVPLAPGDSLRVLGAIEIPGRAAVHPFAEGADRYYEYEIGDTVTLLVPGRAVELVEVRVRPTRGDEALVVGSIWVDASTGDVAAMQVRFVGAPLWADEEHPEGSAWANRIVSVSATLEQGLWETRYWLPYRQELELRVRVPFIGNFAIPVVFRSEFGRYRINGGQPIAWLSPDSLRAPADSASRRADRAATVYVGPHGETEAAGAEADSSGRTLVRAGPAFGGWEIVRPPDDTLTAYDEWDRPLETPASTLSLPSAEELERRARALAPEIVGARMFAIQYDRLPELIRYNRVEALGLGLSARYDLPRRAFWSLGAAAGFGVADREPKGRLDLRHDGPGRRIELAGYSELHLAGGVLTDERRAYGNAFRALFMGRDDADYYRASGVALTAGRRWGRITARAGLGWEDHRSVSRHTQVAVPGLWTDSVFQANPAADEGGFWRADAAATFYLGDWTRPTNRAELSIGVEGGAGPDTLDYLQPRVALEGRADLGRALAVALALRGAWTAGDAPAQRLHGIGGLATVRGFTYGTQRGDAYWAGRLELRPGRRVIAPVVFADAGWAGPTRRWPGTDLLWSVGAGLSFLHGAFRADLVLPKADNVWLELYFAGSL